MPTAANTALSTSTGAYDLALEYAYDLSGRMTSESRTENGATLTSVFAYDPLGQLTSFSRSDGQSESYAYDPVGNMTAKTQNGVSTTMRYNAANQLVQSVTGGETTKYSYDANGNLVRSENAGGARSYAYNALNLLESFTREDGYTENYSYNANRLLSEIRTNEDLTTTLTWDILYGDGVVISAAQNGQTTSFTYGLERISALTGRTRTEYVYDGRGSVAAEVSYNNAWYTFGGGLARKNVVSKSYSPFGELLTEQTSGFGYNGEYYNAATGMIYLRARFYEPEMNRFGQKDILRGSAINSTSINRYAYCINDPLNFCDPSGESLKTLWNSAKNFVSAVSDTVNTVTTAIKTTVSSATKTVVSTVKKTVASAKATVQATKSAVVTSVSSSLKNGDTLKQTITNAAQAGATTFRNGAIATASIATSGAKSVQQTVSTGIDAVKATVTQGGNKIISTGKQFLAQTANAIANFLLIKEDELSDRYPLLFDIRPKTWVSNWIANQGIENNYNSTINDQLFGPIGEGNLGYARMSGTGCEVIAVYNALTLKDINASIAEIVFQFELTNSITSIPFVLYGSAGSNPYSIRDVLSLYDESVSRVHNIQGMEKEGIYIISFWNNNDVLSFSGLHTIVVEVNKVNSEYHYNTINYNCVGGEISTTSFEEFTDIFEDGFITGYYLGEKPNE